MGDDQSADPKRVAEIAMLCRPRSARSQSSVPSGLIRKAGGSTSKRAGPVPPARRTGVSSGVFGQEGYGPLRHASSVD